MKKLIEIEKLLSYYRELSKSFDADRHIFLMNGAKAKIYNLDKIVNYFDGWKWLRGWDERVITIDEINELWSRIKEYA